MSSIADDNKQSARPRQKLRASSKLHDNDKQPTKVPSPISSPNRRRKQVEEPVAGDAENSNGKNEKGKRKCLRVYNRADLEQKYIVATDDEVVVVCHAREVDGELHGNAVVRAIRQLYTVTILAFSDDFDAAFKLGKEYAKMKNLKLIFIDENNVVRVHLFQDPIQEKICKIVDEKIKKLSEKTQSNVAETFKKFNDIFDNHIKECQRVFINSNNMMNVLYANFQQDVQQQLNINYQHQKIDNNNARI
uniref:Uncharacterized protein n=1 Tax=Panagrolaimus sp. ES5 TaxID=591445 RepID=A0AC34F8K3_9BILA